MSNNILQMAIIRGLEVVGNRISRKLKKSKEKKSYQEELKEQEKERRRINREYCRKYGTINPMKAASKELEEWMLSLGCNKIYKEKKR